MRYSKCGHVYENTSFIVQGKLKYQETVREGFDNIFETFVGLFSGENVGKAVVKA